MSLNEADSVVEFSDVEFTDVEFKVCNSNSFQLTSNVVPLIWHEKPDGDSGSETRSISGSISDSKFLNSIEWRVKLLNDLSTRNLKEHLIVDKISVPYSNDVKTSSF